EFTQRHDLAPSRFAFVSGRAAYHIVLGVPRWPGDRSCAGAKSALPGKPGAHRACRRAALAVTIIEGVLVDETENIKSFLVRSHHELTVRRESAPEWLILVARRVRAFQVPCESVACCSVMTSVASPPRRPSTLAIRSLCPVHVPTSEGTSALMAGVETRVATSNDQIRRFIWEPPCC